jgi:uncharacterized protein with PIN domain
MSRAIFRFLGRLNDFLKRDFRGTSVRLDFQGRQSVKHLAESLGVPHPEVGLVQVNGEPAGLERIAQDGDKVVLRPIPDGLPAQPRFLLDEHLGRLAGHLRMLGFDTLYRNDYEDTQLAEIAAQEARILLTRDRRLLMRKVVQSGYCLRSMEPLEQVKEVLQRFQLTEKIQPFHRCLRCNHPLETVDKADVLDRLEPLTRKYFDEFQICPACSQIYWKGSHYEHMLEVVAGLEDSQDTS